MRKVVLFLHMSLDGFNATEDGSLSWIPYSESFQSYNDKIVASVGTAVYGHITYEMMKSYWESLREDPNSSEHDRAHAEWLKNINKVVVSTTLPDQDWNNTRVIRENVAEEIAKLKEEPGKDLVVFGSITLATSLMQDGIVDEFQFTISPVMLGTGKSFVRQLQEKVTLELLKSEEIKGGIMGLHYKVLPLTL